MPFFLVDDRLHVHPKLLSMPRGAKRERAIGLWTIAGSWSAGALTEGEIPMAQITEWGSSRAVAQQLVDAGLWEVTETGYRFHDWTGNGNKTRAEIEAAREAKRIAGAKGGQRSGETRRKGSKPEAPASLLVEPQAMPSQAIPNPSLLTLVCRRLSRGTRETTTDGEIEMWTELAGAADLEVELKAWLMHNADTELRNPAAALRGWLEGAAKRSATTTSAGCSKCRGGWLEDEFGQPSATPCPACRPHLRVAG